MGKDQREEFANNQDKMGKIINEAISPIPTRGLSKEVYHSILSLNKSLS